MGDQNAAFLQSRIPPNKKQISGRRFRPTTVLRLRSHRFYWEHNCQVVIFLIHSFPSITPPPPTHPPQSEIKRHSWIKQSVGDWLESYILFFFSRIKNKSRDDTHTHKEKKSIVSLHERLHWSSVFQKVWERTKRKWCAALSPTPFFSMKLCRVRSTIKSIHHKKKKSSFRPLHLHLHPTENIQKCQSALHNVCVVV